MFSSKQHRNSLEKLYFGFIRHILEYGSVVWDNCTREQSDLIESVQYESASFCFLRLFCKESHPNSPYNLTLEVPFRRPVTILADSYCTDSIRSGCSLVQLSQTTLPYSRIGLIKPK
jgi:hypothetical protein